MRLFWFFIHSLFLTIILYSSQLMSETIYKTPLEKAEWKHNGNKFSCAISHDVNSFWKMELVAFPGELLQFSLVANEELIMDRYLELSIVPPYWVASTYQPKVKFYNVEKVARTYMHGEQLLEALALGWQWQVDISDEQSLLYRLKSSPIYTQEVAREFFNCRTSLLPKPFSYVRNLELLFDEGSEQLRDRNAADVDAVAAYVKADKSIEKILVDGHTDSVGADLNNLYLSQLRVDEVVARLVEQGVERKVIEVRHHGERYPKANNRTSDGRQINRRVKIRLVKQS